MVTLSSELQPLTSTERQAATVASRVPSVREAARNFGFVVEHAANDATTTAVAREQLDAAVADALVESTSVVSEQLIAFATQAALFSVGVPIFMGVPNMGLAAWITSMPDEAIDGLRNSLVETARAMDDQDAVARIIDAPKEKLASFLAQAVPNATSSIIVDSDDIVEIVSGNGEFDPISEATKLMVVDAANDQLYSIKCLAERHGDLFTQLKKFSFSAVAVLLSGLLIRPENHTATARIEALLYLAAIACCGVQKPGKQQLQEWLGEIDEDPITKLEIPVEDVFVTNVGTTFGNARLFQGSRENSAEYVWACIETLLNIGKERSWAITSLEHIMALLRVSEALAERTGLKRYTRTESTPRGNVILNDLTWQELSCNRAVFNEDDLSAIGVDSDTLRPFVIQSKHFKVLDGQTIRQSVLERYPLVTRKGDTIVALPTAISAAIVKFSVEQSVAAGDLQQFQSTLHLIQFSEAFQLGRPGWDVKFMEMLEPDQNDEIREFVGKFDEGGYFHFIFVPDDFKIAVEVSTNSSRPLEESVSRRIHERALRLANKHDYKRGLTVLVHGGIGRRISHTLEDHTDCPLGWQQFCVNLPDFLLLGSLPDFTALRAWKLLQQAAELKDKDTLLLNLRGFVNLVAYAYAVNFELAPKDISNGNVYLHSDFLLPMRHKVRTVIDRHSAKLPSRDSWVSIQRQSANDPEEYFSVEHMVEGEVLTCVESTSRPWWVQFDDRMPEDGWSREIVFSILKTAVSWLVRFFSTLENRYPELPSGPIVFRIRFPQIAEINQHNFGLNRTVEAPSVEVQNGDILINCHPCYLHSFLVPGNLGDRLMIVAIARGLEALCNSEPLPDSAMNEWARTVSGSEHSHFLKLRVSETPSDMIYDAIKLPVLRLPMPEDVAWSQLGLARLAGYEGLSGQLPLEQESVNLLNQSVDFVWKRIEQRLVCLSRESTVERVLLNFISARKEHRDWMLAMTPRLAVYDPKQVEEVSIRRVYWRDIASLVSRVIAEMAMCTSPFDSGNVCSRIDLDFLIAEVYTLLICANQSDALRYELTDRSPVVLPNGTFEFDELPLQMSTSMMKEHWQRQFHDAVEQQSKDEELVSQAFELAFSAEFGLTLEQYKKFVIEVTTEAIKTSVALVKRRRNEVLQWLRNIGVLDAEKAFTALALCPRDRWDEQQPSGAKRRDWYPWSFDRRLSVLRRPIIQLSWGNDAPVILAPSMLADTLGYLTMAEDGRRPESVFDSSEMITFVGSAADKRGHKFARRVEDRLQELGWTTDRELSLTQFGGSDELGDVDVLCWNVSCGLVYVIECKSLRYDRTIGEIGLRLTEYAAGTIGEKRTPLQKHLDRMSFFKNNPQALVNVTDIPSHRMQLRSALVTENLSSLQFGGDVRRKLDIVTDYEQIEEQFCFAPTTSITKSGSRT